MCTVPQSSINYYIFSLQIARRVILLASFENLQALGPETPYEGKKVFSRQRLKLVEDAPISRSDDSEVRITRRIKPHQPPRPLPELSDELTPEEYCQCLAALLFHEEREQERQMDMFQLESVQFSQFFAAANSFEIPVPGLAEKRPSVITGDVVQASVANSLNGFAGRVTEVRLNTIIVKFGPKFRDEWKPSRRFNVKFLFNRHPFKCQHEALTEVSETVIQRLFPSTLPRLSFPPPSLAPNDLNPEQKITVQHIMALSDDSPPYVIYGPPGTGKTTTVVHAIVNVLMSHNSSTHVLACAPSNSAADLLLERCVQLFNKLNSSNLTALRLNARNRPELDISQSIKGYCASAPVALSRICGVQLVVCTCVSASSLYCVEVPSNHFSHVFVDEAGNSMETEALVPISFFGENAKIILAGDPMQLGPIILCSDAQNILGVSLLERLTRLPVYKDQTQSSTKTMLRRNYRSHPSIIAVSNEMFYNGELIPNAPADRSHAIVRLKPREFPNVNEPVIFHSVAGRHEREGNSPSWFNVLEIDQVCWYIRLLTKTYHIQEEDIGVITPYSKQVKKLRNKFRENKWDDIKVGSVEQFQGQERKVIIISTVRSTRDYDDFDEQHNIGFLSNPKRFNVAITRAQALMIVVGDSSVLVDDVYWGRLLRYCRDQKSLAGFELNHTKVYDRIMQELLQYSPTEEVLSPEPPSHGEDPDSRSQYD
jgi:helicase MOV-10